MRDLQWLKSRRYFVLARPGTSTVRRAVRPAFARSKGWEFGSTLLGGRY